jgi:hypothetical protein
MCVPTNQIVVIGSYRSCALLAARKSHNFARSNQVLTLELLFHSLATSRLHLLALIVLL